MRVQRTFGFIDLSGFTSFTETHADPEVIGVLATMRAAVRNISTQHGVRVAKWLGDGAMFVGVQPDPLVATVLEIERHVDDDNSPLALRAGMASGEVMLFEGDDYVGISVNVAARLCDVAGPHEVLATMDLAPSIPDWADAHTHGPLTLRGVSEPVPVLRVCRKGSHVAL